METIRLQHLGYSDYTAHPAGEDYAGEYYSKPETDELIEIHKAQYSGLYNDYKRLESEIKQLRDAL